MSEDFPVTPEILLRAYAAGVFPMAESAADTCRIRMASAGRGARGSYFAAKTRMIGN